MDSSMAIDRPSKPTLKASPRLAADGTEDAGGYAATTRNVQVRVSPQFDAERSKPQQGQFFWLYTVEISNAGRSNVQLLSRHWKITDAQGRVQEVKGDGVVGEQPVIAPGEEFSYTSGCPLPTPTGFMVGTYQMVTAAGVRFEAQIPTFSLDSPYMKRSLN
jgi:ApaG protein